jgi:hypothetical protein
MRDRLLEKIELAGRQRAPDLCEDELWLSCRRDARPDFTIRYSTAEEIASFEERAAR